MSKKDNYNPLQSATTLPADFHEICLTKVSPSAIKVIDKLNQAGFEAYLVGGAVRDLLLNLSPKDFDVATNATPEQCRRLFSNSRIIGRRFQIVHVRFGREMIEVTTFRGEHQAPVTSSKKNKHSAASTDGMLLRDNVFGNIKEDALRRDFTCNALYLNIKDNAIYDFCDGTVDIQQKTLRLIGEPVSRYKEDPVRMLRAVRFKAKLNFELDQASEQAITDCHPFLGNINSARLFDESLKLFLSGYSEKSFNDLEKYHLLPHLLSRSEELLQSPFNRTFVNKALQNTDNRIQQGKSINPAFLWAVFLWPHVVSLQENLEHDQHPPMAALYEAANTVLAKQQKLVAITKRFQAIIKEIWELQLRLQNTKGKRCDSAYHHPRFRAAYDFLLLREQAGENCDNLGQFWTDYQVANPKEAEPPQQFVKKPRRRKATKQ